MSLCSFQTAVLATPPGRPVDIAALVEERRSEQDPCRDREIFEDTQLCSGVPLAVLVRELIATG